jgi:hypothetical protein
VLTAARFVKTNAVPTAAGLLSMLGIRDYLTGIRLIRKLGTLVLKLTSGRASRSVILAGICATLVAELVRRNTGLTPSARALRRRRLDLAGGADYAVITPDEAPITTTNPPTISSDPAARRIGRIAGATIRREMGYPVYSIANRTVAIQRLEAYRREYLPALRSRYVEAFTAHGLYWVFQTTALERLTFERLHTVDAAVDRRIPNGDYDYTASWWGWWLPEFAQRALHIAPFVGPGFQ